MNSDEAQAMLSTAKRTPRAFQQETCGNHYEFVDIDGNIVASCWFPYSHEHRVDRMLMADGTEFHGEEANRLFWGTDYPKWLDGQSSQAGRVSK